MTGYCLKCREHREMRQAKEVTLKNGRLATHGKCSECGTTMFRMGGQRSRGRRQDWRGTGDLPAARCDSIYAGGIAETESVISLPVRLRMR